MSTAIVIDSYEIRQIWHRKISPSSKFDELAVKFRRLASKVKQEWSNFPEEDRKVLTDLAYALIESPPKGISSWPRKIRSKIYLWFVNATNQAEAFWSCIEALDMLVENILDAVERQDPRYQGVLSDTLEQLYLCPDQGEELKPEETRDWLRSLSDEALREV
ncbi:hypothetical protein VF14_03020 [Nostoc linckia z18]|uniref:Uncharacterized protein n=2 Tax=Nostoc linckia TaxID=92942 RepID=A0A9Q5ZHD1_NOSLI|nr:hypothetical protein [Nostoc linckia]PHK42355.1 hypothetical protein VF12_03035 [Nostoc linckia z15]PHK46796.1 hypothetical protein VF13_08905 [Nostoc linckia z16]PHJ69125.1 hypothetical protein VF02_00490 [Nostoc linckia z1]PHJ73276.1 hypothetical protein VF05_01505 [Nostoc linckia z3]PHJ78623.1 hypothetical protein VF03_00490 [Nostoc linckia z2]